MLGLSIYLHLIVCNSPGQKSITSEVSLSGRVQEGSGYHPKIIYMLSKCGLGIEIFFIIFIIIGGVGLSPLGTAGTSGLLYKPQIIDEDDCGAIGGMKIGRGNRSTRRKPAPAPLCPPQIPHDQTRARTPGHRGGKPVTA
jgi:hypothetical protein